MNDLLTLDDIAEALHLRRAFVRDRLVKRPNFPRPAIAISQKNRLWRRADVSVWMQLQAKCPDCDGKGYWIKRAPSTPAAEDHIADAGNMGRCWTT